MPELPEVENVRSSLSQEIRSSSRLERIHFFREDLRFPIPIKEIHSLLGSELLRIDRRGKYILFIFSNGLLASHLGMTGNWRVTSTEPLHGKHDHVQLHFSSGQWLTFSDPRRFGYLVFVPTKTELMNNRHFQHLGHEPLTEEFNAHYLCVQAKGSQRSVKAFLMDQRVVVGVGNIYASEALFLARVRPSRKAKAIKKEEWIQISNAIKTILKKAIRAGGSSIRDYRNTQGDAGRFQEKHKVYGKKDQPCPNCQTLIKSSVIVGRSTFWCPHCQK